MRQWSWMFLIMAAAVGLAVLAQDNLANVALLVPPYRIDLSLNLVIVSLIGLFILLYGVLRLTAWTLGFPGRVRAYRERRQQERETQGLLTAWTAWLEGRYARALREAESVIALNPQPLYATLSSIIAARACTMLQEPERAQAILESAKAYAETDASQRTLLQIAETETALEQGRFGDAQQALQHLHKSGRRTVFSLRLALRAYQGLKNWPEVLKILRGLTKRRALHHLISERASGQAAFELIQEAASDGLQALEQAWRFLSATERQLPRVASRAADYFQRLGAIVMARQALEQSLSHQWSVEAITAYAHSAGAVDGAIRLEQAESWLRQRPGDALLLRVLGELCIRSQLWGQALQYLRRSLADHASPRTHALLARTLELIGRPDEAVTHWRAATGLTYSDIVDLGETSLS